MTGMGMNYYLIVYPDVHFNTYYDYGHSYFENCIQYQQ